MQERLDEKCQQRIAEISRDIYILYNAIYYVPGTVDYNNVQEIIAYLQKEIAYIQENKVLFVAKDADAVKKLEMVEKHKKYYLEDIKNKQETFTAEELQQLCLKQKNAHKQTLVELSNTKAEVNRLQGLKQEMRQWKEFMKDTFVKAADKTRITAWHTRRMLRALIMSLQESENPDVYKAYDIKNSKICEAKAYNIEKERGR